MSISEFFSMGGYGTFVWTSFGISATLMIAELLLLRSHHRSTIKRLKRLNRAQSRQ